MPLRPPAVALLACPPIGRARWPHDKRAESAAQHNTTQRCKHRITNVRVGGDGCSKQRNAPVQQRSQLSDAGSTARCDKIAGSSRSLRCANPSCDPTHHAIELPPTCQIKSTEMTNAHTQTQTHTAAAADQRRNACAFESQPKSCRTDGKRTFVSQSRGATGSAQLALPLHSSTDVLVPTVKTGNKRLSADH